MPTQPKVCISILNWNRAENTLECLESVIKQDYENYEIIVVDNASADGSVLKIKEKYPDIQLIENKNNLGFTGGNNQVMRYALEHGADYVWLLNNDTIVENNTLSKIVSSAERNKYIGMVSPIICFWEDKDSIQFQGSYVDWSDLSIIYAEQGNRGSYSEYQDGDAVCLWGTALLIKRTLIENIGYLNDAFFAYWEDTEYSIRALKAGYKNIICNEAILYHNTTVSTSGTKQQEYYYYMFRNGLCLRKYCRNNIQHYKFLRQYASKLMHTMSSFIEAKEREKVMTLTTSVWHGMKNIGGQMRNSPEMPWLLKKFIILFASYPPYFWAYLLEGKYVLTAKKSVGKLRKYFSS